MICLFNFRAVDMIDCYHIIWLYVHLFCQMPPWYLLISCSQRCITCCYGSISLVTGTPTSSSLSLWLVAHTYIEGNRLNHPFFFYFIVALIYRETLKFAHLSATFVSLFYRKYDTMAIHKVVHAKIALRYMERILLWHNYSWHVHYSHVVI